MNKNIFWSVDKLLTYNALINIVIGERGVGKSYSTKKYAIKKAIKKGRKFIYLRRYETELDLLFKEKDGFYKDIKNDEDFKGIDFKIESNIMYANDKPIGYFIALSKQHQYKSIPYPDVDTIIYDEVFIENGRYLKNEVISLLEFIETVGRLRNIKVFLLSNMVSIVNPYFMYFDLTLPYGKDIKLFKEGTISVCYIKNEVYREVKRETTFGKLIKGTQYEKYAIDNTPLKDTKDFIRKKSRGSYHIFNIFINGNSYGVWKDTKNQCIIISKDYNIKCPINLSFDFNSHTEKTTLARTRSPYFKSLINAYSNSILYFESNDIKENIMLLLQKYLF